MDRLPKQESDWIPQPLYNKIAKCIPIISVEALIVRGDELLFLRRINEPAKGEWWFPGGRIRKGESIEQTLRREVKEETGLIIIAYKLINVYSRVFPERHDVTIAYLCRCKKGEVKLNDEHSECAFFKAAPEGLHRYLVETVRDFQGMRV
jgi:colanic acid biosynthesis protein WcaH